MRITYQQGCVEIVVSNRRPPNAEACQAGAGSKGGGYGLSGMAERAALVGAELVTGPDPDGAGATASSSPFRRAASTGPVLRRKWISHDSTRHR